MKRKTDYFKEIFIKKNFRLKDKKKFTKDFCSFLLLLTYNIFKFEVNPVLLKVINIFIFNYLFVILL